MPKSVPPLGLSEPTQQDAAPGTHKIWQQESMTSLCGVDFINTLLYPDSGITSPFPDSCSSDP